jgi:hypothetical protein
MSAKTILEHDSAAAEDRGDPVYLYKPNLMGSPWVFRLGKDGLEWEYGRRSGTVPYDSVQRVRMSFRPATLQTQRFITEIWAPQSPKLQISSTTFRSLMEQARQDDDYTAFVTELHRRFAAAGSTARFESGMHPALYWLGAAVFTTIGVTLAGFLLHTLRQSDWAGAAMVGGVLLLLAWQTGMIFRRNRPQTYRPDAPPQVVLPRG